MADELFAFVCGALGFYIVFRRKEVTRLIYLLSDGREMGIKPAFPPPLFKITNNAAKWRTAEQALVLLGCAVAIAACYRLYLDLFVVR
jgi:hypothetical protein